MTVDPGGFTLAQLRHSVSGPPRVGIPSHMYPIAAYEYGRYCEARVLAAYGLLLGYFPRDATLRWLNISGRNAVRAREEWIPAEDVGRVPSPATSGELLSASETAFLQIGRQGALRRFLGTLLVRSRIDSSPLLRSFYAMLLFAPPDDWGMSVQTAEVALEDPNLGLGNLLVDGAYRASTFCAETVNSINDSDESHDLVASWPKLSEEGKPLKFYGFGWLSKAGDPPDVVAALLSMPPQESHPQYVDAALLRGVLKGTLALWATVPQRHPAVREDRSWTDLVRADSPVLELLASRDLGTLERSFEYGLSWASLLWRLSPTDSRTLGRYEECVDLAVRYLMRQSF